MGLIADRLVEIFAPLWTQDQEDWHRAIGGMFAEVEGYVDDDPDGTPGWTLWADPDRCPDGGLDYLGQYAGERFGPGISADDKRVLIKTQPNKRRGSPAGIARAAQKWLTGSRVVQIIERVFPDGTPDPDGDHFTVYTYTSQTPNRDQVWQELLKAIPADMVCNYQVIDGATWAGVEAEYATWADLAAAFDTWAEVAASTPGASVWTW